MDNIEKTTKKFITSLLTSTPLVVTMYQLSKDYRNTIGEPIPYQKLGYNSLEHFLRSIDDTVLVKGSGPMAQITPVYSEKSAHVNTLVQNQRVAKPRNRSNFQSFSRRMTYVPTRAAPPAKPNRKFESPQPIRKMHYPSVKDVSSSSKSSSYSSIDYVTYDNEPKSNIKKDNIPQVASKVFSQTTSLTNNINITDPSRTDMSRDVKNVDAAVKETSRLEDKKKSQEKPIKFVINKKCTSVKNLMKNITADKSKQMFDQEDRVPYFIRNNLRSLIGQFPNGIWCAELPEKYRKMFKQELNYQELGYNNLIDLCICLGSIFHYVRPSTDDFKLYDKSRPLPECAEKKFTVASYAVNKKAYSGLGSEGALPRIDWADVHKYLPDDIFKPGEEIPRTFIGPDVQENDTIDVLIGEIYDLSKFWVYLLDPLLDDLMDDMQTFYKEHGSEYEIPDNLIKEGLYCVQVIYGEYHRALIVDIMPDVEDTIRVIFIDYGTMTKVSTKGLCFLHTQFSTLPAQAIRCRLANVVPIEEGVPWSREASRAFRNLLTDRDMTAKISHINREDQILEVYLADVTDEDNIFYVNDKLVQEGFATYPDKNRQSSHVDPIYTPIVKLIHLFPTFLELEHGLAPSTAEMEVFHDLDIPVNFCYPQYFYVDYSFEEEIIKNVEEHYEKNQMKMKRRIPSRFYDVDKRRQSPLDFSIFGELESEIKSFLTKSTEENDEHNSDEDFADAEEEFLQMDQNFCEDSLTQQLKALSTKEEETVNVLKRDLLVTEDIMKDINLICNIENSDNDKGRVSTEYLSDNKPVNNYVTSEYIPFEDYSTMENERELWTINETVESMEFPHSPVSYKESPDEDGEQVYFNHPLSKMSFDKGYSTEDELSSSNSPISEHGTKYDLQSPDIEFKPVNFSSFTDTGMLPSGDAFMSQITEILKANQSQCEERIKESDVREKQLSEANDTISTNPFLNGSADSNDDTSLKDLRLNPNNPFLTFLHKSDSNASNSTTHNSPVVQVKTVHAWSRFEDMSAETISELGRSLSSKSSSTSSLMVMDDKRNCSISTQTSKEEVATTPVGNLPSYPQFYPQPVAYGYTQWSLACANPYYGQLNYYEPRGPAYRPQTPPVPPGFPPPPGFMPLVPNNFRSMPQRMPNCVPGGNFFPGPNVTFCGPRPLPPSQIAGRSGEAAVSSVSVNVMDDGRDFYDVYNELLRKAPE